MSPATALKDHHTKHGLYKQQGIPYYIIISPDTKGTEVYILKDGEYELKENGNDFSYNFQFADDCSVTIDFGEIWK